MTTPPLAALGALSKGAACRPDARPRFPLPRAHAADVPGAWHYRTGPMAPRIPWIALVLSAGVHAFAFFGLNQRPEEDTGPRKKEEVIELMAMPELEELDEPEVEVSDTATETPEPDAGSYVPTLADVPTLVPVDQAFVQPLDIASLQPKPDLNAARVATIPTGMRRASPAALKDVFNLAELDRTPVPVFQPPPQFPHAMKSLVSQGRVEVEFVVEKDGTVVGSRVLSSSHAGFEDAAVAGVNRWKFRPGIKNGKPVRTRMLVPLLFRVTDD